MSTVLDVVGDRLAPVGLAELDARAGLQTRVDSKYVITMDRWNDLVERLAGRASILDIDGRREQTYETTYFDTARLRCYHEHLQRRRLSFKLRSRVYLGSGLHVFEVKLRDGRGHTVKIKIDHGDQPPDVLGPRASAFFRRAIDDRYGIAVTDEVAPSLQNRYTRLTLASTSAPERTTVDHGLTFLDPTTGGVRGSMRADVVLIETKSAHGSGAVDRLLWRLNVRPTRISKYVIGVHRVHGLPAPNRYRAVLSSAFDLAPPGPEVAAVGAPAPVVAVDDLPRPTRPPRPPRAPRPVRAPRVPR